MLVICVRSSNDGDHDALKDEVLLCSKSCLGIFRDVSKSRCNFGLLLNCLQSIAACISFLGQLSTTGEGETGGLEGIEQVVEEAFEIVKKWLNKSLSSKIPCYRIEEAELELKVFQKSFVFVINKANCNLLEFASCGRTDKMETIPYCRRAFLQHISFPLALLVTRIVKYVVQVP